MYVCGAIHTYHTVAFHNLTTDDWVHHIMFAGLIVYLGLTVNGGPGTNVICFVICGLPGGIDYLMLTAVKHGLMEGGTEKRINARVNVWLRAPGAVLVAFSYYVSYRYGDRIPTRFEIPIVVIGTLLVFFNGQYYMQRVVGNAYIKDDTINKVGC